MDVSSVQYVRNCRNLLYHLRACCVVILIPSHSFIPLACAECDDSLPFSDASSIPLCYVFFFSCHQLFFHPLAPYLAIYFFVYLSILFFQNSYIPPFWEFFFLPFSLHDQTNEIYLNLLYIWHIVNY